MSIQIALQYAEELDQTTRNELEQLIIALQTQLPNANLFTKGTLDPDVLPPGIAGGPPLAHHVTHEPGGSDPMTVNAVPAVGSLRTLGTGPNEAAPGNDARFTAAPQAHHASHEPGGADALVNAAWTDQANTFTKSQTLSDAAPALNLTDTSGAANTRRFRVVNLSADGLYFIPLSDAGVAQATPTVLSRGGDLIVGRDLYATGSGGNVACKDQPNTFTQNQTVSAGAPMIWIKDTGAPADARMFRIFNSGQSLLFDTTNDAMTVAQTLPLRLSRPGDAFVGRDVYEKGRPVPMGHWVDVPFSAGNFGGGASMVWTVGAGNVAVNRYTLIGKTLIWTVYVTASSLSGTAFNVLFVAIPDGYTSAGNRGSAATSQLYDTAHNLGYVNVYGADPRYIEIKKQVENNFTLNSGATYIRFTITLEIN